MVVKVYEIEKMMVEFVEIIDTDYRRLRDAQQVIVNVRSTPDGATMYGLLIAALDVEAAANPEDIVLALLKARKDKLVGESAAVKAYAANLEEATTGIIGVPKP